MDLTKLQRDPKTGKYGTVTLIRHFFNAERVTEFKSLTEDDKVQLASAIARQEGISQADCGFAFVEY